MSNLSNRVEALENRVSTDKSMVIFIVAVQPESLKGEITQCHDQHGQSWIRDAGEDEESFKERVKREALKTEHGVAMVFCFQPSDG